MQSGLIFYSQCNVLLALSKFLTKTGDDVTFSVFQGQYPHCPCVFLPELYN
ncbi:MAG: hypothetical protein ACD_81C00078G0001 [uncultured bacterium]|nr:MAG: hypothetical protein ACD_81C00078G0001 [uncultured bacterium]